ncbi:coiled-coil protein [Legionella beliardensis]|uniref:Coiled-coil protein n=1 Tax=Legionella beliardensis TaxID=91822 RepID=A0A378HYC1_9GAMM|nr:zeta toxin family protein [Legionella beliardensis]STX27693.1 coiled-coil protein [Legionella beliardensis]
MKIFIKNNKVSRYQDTRSLWQKLELLIAHDLYQYLGGNKPEAMHIATVLLSDFKKKSIAIADKVIDEITLPKYRNLILQHLLNKLYSESSYHVFLEKFALRLSGGKETQLTLSVLQHAGINDTKRLHDVFVAFVSEQKKLAKNFPNFSKIKNEDDYEQFISVLASNPLYEKFLSAFTTYLADAFNDKRESNTQVAAPTVLTPESLLDFFQAISTDIVLGNFNHTPLKKGTLYVEIIQGDLYYTTLNPSGLRVSGFISSNEEELNCRLTSQTTKAELKPYLPHILTITAARGHTSQLVFRHTASLRDKAQAFLTEQANSGLLWANLPASDFIVSEENKFILNHWLADNLPCFINHLIEDSCDRYEQQLKAMAEHAKNQRGMTAYIANEINEVSVLMKDIMHSIIFFNLEKSVYERNSEIDSKLEKLINHIKQLQEFYNTTPLQAPNEVFPKIRGNFEAFINNLIFNRGAGVIHYTSATTTWRLDLISLIEALVKDKAVQVCSIQSNNMEYSYLTDEIGQIIPSHALLREELKLQLTHYLSHDIQAYHRQALCRYHAENLPMTVVKAEPLLATRVKLSVPSKPFNLPSIKFKEAREQAYRHYNMRHILTLKSYTDWTLEERRLQETHNRILQPNFMEGLIDEQLNHAQVAQEKWLTDVLVPRWQTALFLNIAARLITDYRIDTEQVNETAKQLWFDILFSRFTKKLMNHWQTMSLSVAPLAGTGIHENCVAKAKQRMSSLYSALTEDTFDYDVKFQSCLIIEKNKVRKQLINTIIKEFLDNYLDLFTKGKLENKSQYPIGSNKDYVFLGPAASGKSTISNQYIQQQERSDYISLATDDYRGIYLPATDIFEQQDTEQVFIRTQDSAYLISELVEDRLCSLKDKRPNIIVDGVTYKPAHRALIETNNNSIIVCACLDDMAEVVKRSYDRAMREDSSSADRGRYVNTTSLIQMHKAASVDLIASCPPNTKIAFYNTNIPRGEVPPLIATIDTHHEKTLTIHHEKGALLRLTSFFNKKRLNVSAKNDNSLFMSNLQKPGFQIESLFSVLKHGFKIVLHDDQNNPCLIVSNDGMVIHNAEYIKEKLTEKSNEKELLKMMLLYGKYGSLKEVKKQCLIYENSDVLIAKILTNAMDKLQEGNISLAVYKY